MTMCKSNLLFRSFFLVAVCFLTYTRPEAQCQDQTCALNQAGNCYQCTSATGQGCNEKSCSHLYQHPMR